MERTDRASEESKSSSKDTSPRQSPRPSSKLQNLDYPRAASESGSDEDSNSGNSESSELERPIRDKPEKQTRTMHSLLKYTGVQGTQMKHLLVRTFQDSHDRAEGLIVFHHNFPTHHHKSLDKNPDAASIASSVGNENDPERQTSEKTENRSANDKATSLKRKLYIFGTAIACIVLIVLGIVLGLPAVHEREHKAESGMDKALASDHAMLVAQGERVQAQLAGTTLDHSKDEIHKVDEDDYDDDNEDEETAEPLSTLADDDLYDSSGNARVAIPVSTAAAIPVAHDETAPVSHALVSTTEPGLVHGAFPDLQNLFLGNQRFINETNSDAPGLLKELGQGQTPEFAFLGCSDSRVSETVVLGAKVGDIFTSRNIGNQFLIDSLATEAVLSYAISHLGVQHIVVLGHTKCGAVLAAIASESKTSMSEIGENRIMTWIRPIRSLYQASTRPEIVKFRTAFSKKETRAEDVTSEVWNALIEENVKTQVKALTVDPSVLKSWKTWGEHQSTNLTKLGPAETGAKSKRSSRPSVELWIHGWVYDVDTGLVHDLGISVGPRLV
ncbi:carbonic anhydrase [Sporobolomyces koalae]|uniref:carbonic anhydrase n=1 Tax=Sporobolomyces koalae TaxID=500713 RepID=UPI00317A8323